MRGNTATAWGSVSIGLHWLVAGLILLVQVPAGILMLAVEPGLLQNTLFNIHKNVGLVILVLALFRLAWRLAQPVPRLPEDVSGWQQRLAGLSHFVLYALLFVLPISGYLYTAFGGFPVPVLMLVDIGPLVPADEARAEVWKTVHYAAQYVLYAVVSVHAAAALHHHFVRGDDVLRRMMRRR